MTTAIARPTELGRPLLELAAEIRNRHRSILCELRINTVEGGVILHGRAYCFYGKQMAQHEVLRRTGLVLLSNRITVASRPRSGGE